MKATLFFIFSVLSINLCFAQTQLELNERAHRKFKQADDQLNTIYKSILKEYKADTLFIENLKVSQRIWVQFRDAEMKMKYPDREPGYYGSIQPMCWSMYLTQLTEERIKTLKQWLNGIEEGEVCEGSVKARND